jgi:hypothetical protein
VQVVVLDRLRYTAAREFVTPLTELLLESPQLVDLVALERQVSPPEQIIVASREHAETEVGNSVGEVITDVYGLTTLQLRIRRQDPQPQFRRVAQAADRCARVLEE